jgi:hypothetical protein
MDASLRIGGIEVDASGKLVKKEDETNEQH